MPEIPDYDVESSTVELFPKEPQPRLRLLVTVVGVLGVIALVAALILVLRGPGSSTTTEPVASPAAIQSSDRPLASAVEPINLPPLDATDSIVRELVEAVQPSARRGVACD